MRTRFFFRSFIFIIFGAAIGIYFPYAYFASAFCALISLIIFIKNRPLAVCVLLMAAVTLISANMHVKDGKYYQDITIEGTVENVRVYDNRTEIIIDNCNHKEIGRNKIIYYIWRSDSVDIKPGNKIKLTGNASPVKEKILNPGEWHTNYLADGINYRFYAEECIITDDSVNI